MMKSLFLGAILLLICLAGHAQNYKFGKVSKQELLQQSHPKYQESDAAILYREISSKIDYDKEEGYVIYTEVFDRIKIYNPEGYKWANGNIKLRRSSKKSNRDQLTSLKGFTYVLKGNKVEDIKLKNDGIFEEETSKYSQRVKFTMPSLMEGCIIEYKYKLKSPFLGNIDPYLFQASIPVDKVKFRFEAPEYFNYEQHQRGWIPFSIERESANRTITEHYTSQNNIAVGSTYSKAELSKTEYKANILNVNIENIPPLKEEAYAGNIKNYASSLQMELTFVRFPSGRVEDFSSTWESVSSSIYKDNDFGQQLEKTGYFEDDLRTITSGVSGDTDKMKIIFDFIKRKMTWNSYAGIYAESNLSKAYKEGTGNTADINLMLTAMLRKAGLKANPVLISSTRHGIPLLPTQTGFNFVVAGVETPEDIILLDATNKYGQPDVLEPHLINWRGRVIREDGSSDWVTLQSNTKAASAYMCDMNVNTDGWLTGSMKAQHRGSFAMENRMTYVNLSEFDRSSRFSEEIENVEISELEFENLAETNKPLKINYDFKTDAYSENIDGDLYITPLAFLVMDENPFNSEKRVFPIDFGKPQKFRYMVNIGIPEGYRIISLPQGANLKLGNNNLAFKYLISERGGKIAIMGELSVNTHFMGPEVYEDVKGFYQFLVEKEKEKIVLSKT